MNLSYYFHRKARELMGMELPKRMKNLCGSKPCVRPDHWSPEPTMNLDPNLSLPTLHEVRSLSGCES